MMPTDRIHCLVGNLCLCLVFAKYWLFGMALSGSVVLQNSVVFRPTVGP